MEYEQITVAIRGASALIWLALIQRLFSADRPVSPLARRVILMVIGIGMTTFFIGSLVPFGLPGDTAKLVYTAFTVLAGIAGLALLTTGEPHQ